jgi:hypothetical protein
LLQEINVEVQFPRNRLDEKSDRIIETLYTEERVSIHRVDPTSMQGCSSPPESASKDRTTIVLEIAYISPFSILQGEDQRSSVSYAQL